MLVEYVGLFKVSGNPRMSLGCAIRTGPGIISFAIASSPEMLAPPPVNTTPAGGITLSPLSLSFIRTRRRSSSVRSLEGAAEVTGAH